MQLLKDGDLLASGGLFSRAQQLADLLRRVIGVDRLRASH